MGNTNTLILLVVECVAIYLAAWTYSTPVATLFFKIVNTLIPIGIPVFFYYWGIRTAWVDKTARTGDPVKFVFFDTDKVYTGVVHRVTLTGVIVTANDDKDTLLSVYYSEQPTYDGTGDKNNFSL